MDDRARKPTIHAFTIVTRSNFAAMFDVLDKMSVRDGQPQAF